MKDTIKFLMIFVCVCLGGGGEVPMGIVFVTVFSDFCEFLELSLDHSNQALQLARPAVGQTQRKCRAFRRSLCGWIPPWLQKIVFASGLRKMLGSVYTAI